MRLFTFWSFAKTTYVEQMCLASMLASGHDVDLYTYDSDICVPDGVNVKDANSIIPLDQVIYHSKTGSPALFANLFRYMGFSLNLGIWVDTDVVILKKMDIDGEYILGWESSDKVNNAILRLPSNSSFLDYMYRLKSARVPIPMHWSPTKKLRQFLNGLYNKHKKLQDMEWGVIGPTALTHYVKKNDLVKYVQEKEVFYPIHWSERDLFFADESVVKKRISKKTRAVHLWNKGITKEQKNQLPPKGSYLYGLCKQYEVI